MLMPSATAGCASPAALPTANRPPGPPARVPGRVGPAPSPAAQGPGQGAGAAPPRVGRETQHRLAGTVLPAAADLPQPVAADAARQAHPAAVAVYHAPVASGEGQQRHQPGRQVAVVEMG